MAPLFLKSVALTTRKPKADEVHGEQYYFVSKECFIQLVQDGKMAEWGENTSNKAYYGSLKADYDPPVDAATKKLWASSIPYTTRPMREGETAGESYHFISEDEFRKAIKAGEFAEHGEAAGFLYGTKKIPNQSVTDSELKEIYKKTIPYTTRAKKAGEVDGKGYFFISEVDFRAALAKGEFVEWGEAPNGALYGTKKPNEEVREIDLSEVELTTPPPAEAVAAAKPGDDSDAKRQLQYSTSSSDVLTPREVSLAPPVPLSLQASPSKWTTSL